MKIIFMGTPDFSVPILDEIVAAGHDVVAVYSQPPRKKGRGMTLTPTPVAAQAMDYGIDVYTPVDFKSPDDIELFQSHDADAAIVVAYGLLLPQAVLDGTRLGCFNIHASLLPRWRGAAPIQRAIMAGDTETGVMFMKMEAGLDTGPIGLVDRIAITSNMTASSLHDELSKLGADLTTRALAALSRESLAFSPQSEEGVCYAHKISKDEARIDWTETATQILRHIHGLSPFPGAFTAFKENDKEIRLKILSVTEATKSDADTSSDLEAGTILQTDPDFIVKCGDGLLQLNSVQRAGKSKMSVQEFNRGAQLGSGSRLLQAE